MVVVIALFGVAVSLGAWNKGEISTLAGGTVLTILSVGVAGNKSSLSWWNMTWHRTGAASVSTALFSSTLDVGLGSVLSIRLTMYGGGRRGEEYDCIIILRGRNLNRFGRPVGTFRSWPVSI